MNKLLFFLFTLVLVSACNHKNNPAGLSGMPPCMVTKIEEMKTGPQANQPQSVTQYTYKGTAVFYIVAGCCDQFNPVYNSDCDYLGAPDGGITGKGDGKIPDFHAEATNKKVVWENK